MASRISKPPTVGGPHRAGAATPIKSTTAPLFPYAPPGLGRPRMPDEGRAPVLPDAPAAERPSAASGRQPPVLNQTFPPGTLVQGSSAVPVADWDQAPDTAPHALREVPLHDLQPALCILSSGVFAGVEMHVDRTLRIGRDVDNDIRIPGDIAMSRHHAVIVPTEDCLFVEDLGSRNGTFVNGARIGRAPLNHNDRIRIGDTLLQVRYQPRRLPSSANSAPPVGSRGGQGDILRAWRKHKGLTQTDLAARLGVSQRTVSLWEQGAPISAENLKNLREKGGCDLF